MRLRSWSKVVSREGSLLMFHNATVGLKSAGFSIILYSPIVNDFGVFRVILALQNAEHRTQNTELQNSSPTVSRCQ
jgi:hypothetical protein